MVEFGANSGSIGAEYRHLQALADIGAVPFDRQRRQAERRVIGIEFVDKTAGTQHVRIIEQILGTVDRREADIQPVQRCRKLRRLPLFDDLGGARDDSAPRQDAVGGGAKGRIFQKFPLAEFAAKALPAAFGNDTDEDPLAAPGLEDIVDRPGMFAQGHRARFVAGHLILDHMLRHQEQAVFEQAVADVGALLPFL